VADLGRVYAEISAELASIYNLGYISNLPATSARHREMKVATSKSSHCVIQSRSGYQVP
jgi:hypothetical protein